MKKIIFCLNILLVTSTLRCYSQGIEFETCTFAEILKKAQQENKPIFVDFYTTWCAPCKKMSTEIFTQFSVGRLFNDKFINYKIDAEKGEGIELAKKYGVTVYPTMFWLDPQGEPLHKITGTRDEVGFLSEVEIMEKSAEFGGFEEMKKKYESGSADPGFLLRFHNVLPKDNRNAQLRSDVAISYLKSIPEATLCDQEEYFIVAQMLDEVNRFDQELFYRFAEGLAKIRKESKISPGYGLSVLFKIKIKASNFIEEAINERDEALFEELVRYKEYAPIGLGNCSDPDWGLVYGRGIFFASPDFMRLEFLRVNRMEEKFRVAMISYMDKMTKENPKGSWESSGSKVEYHVKAIKNANEKSTGSIAHQNLLQSRTRTIDYFIRWIDYFWCISASDAKTKKQITEWIDYTLALNPYYAKGPLNSSATLVRIGNKKLALATLERSITGLNEIYLGETESAKQLERMLRYVNNDKL